MLLKLITACLFTGVVGVGATTTFNNDLNNNNEMSIRQENKKYVSYDDDNYQITLNTTEVLYVYENLVNAISNLDETQQQDLSVTYNNLTYNLTYVNDEGAHNFDGEIFLITDYEEYNSIQGMDLTSEDNYKFYYAISSLLSSELVINGNSGNYDEIKSAIELDIQANAQPFMLPVLQEVVSLLTSGISALAVGIGGGVSTLVSAIFISNGALSPFGAIIIVFSGIALAIGLSRWVMNFLTSLGAKK